MSEEQTPAGQFVLIIQDNGNGEVAIAGVQRPETFDPKLASHLVGRWLEENIDMVCKLAAAAQLERDQKVKAEDAKVIGPDRERTIVGAGDPVIYTGHSA